MGIATTLEPMTTPPAPAEAKPAATLLLVRDAPSGLEVLVVKRSEHSSFMGGVYVFPGGGVDPQDSSPELAAACVGRSDAEASAVLGLVAGGLAYWISAVRELFEESGILLAHRSDGVPVSLAGERAAHFGAHRAALNARTSSFVEMVLAEGLVLDVGAIAYNAHWITPTTAAKRFDTYFFVARAPEDQVAAHDEGETVAVEWVTPADALERHRAGEIEMVLPTIRNLAFIGSFATTDELLAAAVALRDIPAILPRMVDTEEGPILLVPGDPGYDELPGAEDDPRRFPTAARRRAVMENPPSG